MQCFLPTKPLTCCPCLLFLSVSWGMLPGLWFELFGAHCSGCGSQLPNHPCAYLLPDWPEEESHWLPVCIIQLSCSCLSNLLHPSQLLQTASRSLPRPDCTPPISAIKSFPNFSSFFFPLFRVTQHLPKNNLCLFLVPSLNWSEHPPKLFPLFCFDANDRIKYQTFIIDIASFDYRLHVLKVKFMAE